MHISKTQQYVHVREGKYLGVTISDSMPWNQHVAAVNQKTGNTTRLAETQPVQLPT
ncbi:hypothetical protein DPMN_048036 [Dreissena polymorpha]|uniref:Uncharacterized protein n=1 Tax=Dreissena polymorpha TaxID=45954 RepID=A0A9D4D959_DREPO|nr:hypothetical protein DPMN_048036 [Dreissena polymorpha]